MAPRTTFASLPDGMQNLSLWDQAISDTALLGSIPCTATGTNAITLTPVASVFPPSVTAYQAGIQFAFPVPSNTSGSVTVRVGTLAFLSLFRSDGIQVGSGDLAQNRVAVVQYNATTSAFELVSADFKTVRTDASQALTNKTYNGNTWTAGTGTITINGSKTLTLNNTLSFSGVDGKSLTFSNSLSFVGTDGTTLTFQGTDTYVGRATTDTLTNKTIAAGSNTISGLAVTNLGGVTGTPSSSTYLRGDNAWSTLPSFSLISGTPVTGQLAQWASATSIQGLSTSQIPGTTTNDNASAGNIGEYISSSIPSGSAVSFTTGTAKDVTTISLTAGDWDVWGVVCFLPAGGTTVSGLIAWINTTANTAPTAPNGGATAVLQISFSTGAEQRIQTGTTRLSLASTTTVSLGGLANFGVSTMSVYGFIGARRRR